MTTPIRGYLNELSKQLHLGPQEEREILHEIQAHIEERTEELEESGVPSGDALTRALNDLGASHAIARQFYEVHSRGSWRQTALAVLPHILLSLMFFLHLWTAPGWVAFMLVVAIAISVIGWRMGRPRWTYPWLGYCLVVPVVSWGLAMSAVSYGAWSVLTRGSLPLSLPIYAASLIYVAFSLWVVIRVLSRVARPDWVMASLAVLPVPFLAYWFFYFHSGGEVLQSAGQPLTEVDSSAGVVFLVLALATAVFFRIGRRLVRVALLIITAPSMIVLGWLSYQGGPGYVALFFYSAISLAVLLSPALFDLNASQSKRPERYDSRDSLAELADYSR
jgi:hypothetical protein